MVGEDIIMMTQQELKKLHIVKKIIDRIITQAEALIKQARENHNYVNKKIAKQRNMS
jgi:AraC-like DNA-binding protein